MRKNHFEIVRSLLTNPSTASHFLEVTENLLGADAFNESLIFANGLAAFYLGKLTANFMHSIEILESGPIWMPSKIVKDILPKMKDVLAAHSDPVAINTFRSGSLVRFPIREMHYCKPANELSANELVTLSSSDIGEYAKYREFFDQNYDEHCFQKLPGESSGEIVGHDIKLELSTSPAKPLVIFFQGFVSPLCPKSLRIPSFQAPFSQEALCKRLDPRCEKFSRIFVRDHFQVWYQAGLHGRGSVITLAWQLASMIDSIAPSRIISYGTSAGGFASLLFGHLLGVETSISFSPQTLIFTDPYSSFLTNYRSLFYSRFLEGRPYLIPDITKLQPLQQQARVYYSLDMLDKWHAQRLLPDTNVELIGLASDTHGGYLDKELAESELIRALGS